MNAQEVREGKLRSLSGVVGPAVSEVEFKVGVKWIVIYPERPSVTEPYAWLADVEFFAVLIEGKRSGSFVRVRNPQGAVLFQGRDIDGSFEGLSLPGTS